MTTIERIYDKIITKWGVDNKGTGAITCVPPLSYIDIICGILEKMSAKKPNITIFILIDDIAKRKPIMDAIEAKEIKRGTLTCLTPAYSNYHRNWAPDIFISVGINKYNPCIDAFVKYSTFKLMILTEIGLPVNDLAEIYAKLPAINAINDEDLRHINACVPVEEHNIAVDFPNDEYKAEYDKCSSYISQTIQIFGDFKNIDIARRGDEDKSAMQYVEELARYNGWSETLEPTEFNKQIDALYNPNILKEKAHNCYNIMRTRQNLVYNNPSKLEAVFDIINRYKPYERLMIVSKNGEFASQITDYINSRTNIHVCGDYHDCIESMQLIDNNGVPVVYKTGAKKGQLRIVGAQYISTQNLRRFKMPHQRGSITLLSLKNASKEGISASVNGIIFTSPTMSFDEFRYRHPNVICKENKIDVYTLYTANTIEEKLINKNIKNIDNFVVE